MTIVQKNTLLTWCIAAVWVINGLFCKVLHLVPRHEAIVSRILGAEHSKTFTVLIGISEVFMAFWIVSRFKSKLNTMVQIMVVLFMNVLEFIFVPDLLLWGRWNALFALLFVLVVYYNEFVLNKKIHRHAA
ncbi:MAG: DoxX-like family protein [Flavobacteriaceae bacterium]